MKKHNTLGVLASILSTSLAVGLVTGCEEARQDEDLETDSVGTATDGPTTATPTTGEETGAADTSGGVLDVGNDTTPDLPGCAGDGTCNEIDLLFVIDNSGTMGEEQLNLAANFPLLVDKLENLEDSEGKRVNPSVNIMVTTTDMGHPLCTPFQKPDYTPRQGAPVYEGCNTRINRFTGLEMEDPTVITEACTASCPSDVAPGQPFIHFDVEKTNVPNDDVGAALSCIGPQGIDGCGYEAPLESMLQAINPGSCWNDPQQERCDGGEFNGLNKGFLRDDATLAVVIITDESDCSVTPPGGFSYFTEDDSYWAINPETEGPQASSAVCWNAGVQCNDEDGDGVYESCEADSSAGALHGVDRYVTYLNWLREEQDKEVIMLGILGVPPVTAHNPDPPFEPIEGGLNDLVYRDWVDGEFDGTDMGGDILPDEWAEGVTADVKRFQFGDIGPGCTGQDADGNFTGQAIPPVRVREVCESLNYTDEEGNDQIRCCVESICSTDFSPAIECLTGIIQETIGPVG
ncbi:MAG: hypothetical protein ACE37F_27560 [Nannocystaceae bacterium]|nr:hypothetical protein [bacterium]